jgi:hypothetical protein
MKTLKLHQVIIFFLVTLFTISCNNEYLYIPDSNIKNTTKALLEVSYKMTTTRDYETNSNITSSLDLAILNPSSEKQEIKMELFESGQLDITIEEVDFSKKIKNPHKILPDNSPKIVKTVISGSTVKFYDANGTLLGTENIPIPNHSNLVKTIKTLEKIFLLKTLMML